MKSQTLMNKIVYNKDLYYIFNELKLYSLPTVRPYLT